MDMEQQEKIRELFRKKERQLEQLQQNTRREVERINRKSERELYILAAFILIIFISFFLLII